VTAPVAPSRTGRRKHGQVALTGTNLNPWCAAPDQVWAASVVLHANRPGEPVAAFTYSGLPVHDGIYVLSTKSLAGLPEWEGAAELTLAVAQGETRVARTFLRVATAEPVLIGFPFAASRGEISVSYSVRVANLEHWAGSGLHIEPPRLVRLLDETSGARFFTATRGAGLAPMISANQGGLANRLLPFLSTLDIAAQAGRPAGILWGTNAHCAASLDELFDLGASGLTEDGGDTVVGVDEPFFDYEPTPRALDLNAVAPSRPILVHSIRAITADPFGRPDGAAMAGRFSGLRPSVAVMDRLAAFGPHDLGQAIGLHVRRPFPHGAFRALERSKFTLADEVYRAIIEDLRDNRADVQTLFLATNDPAFERRLKAEFGDYILTQEKRSIDNTRDPRAVQDALVDLILLSRCKALISAQKSDFGYAAALFGRRPLYRLGEAEADGGLDVELWNDGERLDVRRYRRGEDARAFAAPSPS